MTYDNHIAEIENLLANPKGKHPLLQVDQYLRPVAAQVAKELGFDNLVPQVNFTTSDRQTSPTKSFAYVRDVHEIRPKDMGENLPDDLYMEYCGRMEDYMVAIRLRINVDDTTYLSFGIDANPNPIFDKYVDTPRPTDLCLQSRLYNELRTLTIQPSLDIGPITRLNSSNSVRVNFVAHEMRSALELFVHESKRVDSIVNMLLQKAK